MVIGSLAEAAPLVSSREMVQLPETSACAVPVNRMPSSVDPVEPGVSDLSRKVRLVPQAVLNAVVWVEPLFDPPGSTLLQLVASSVGDPRIVRLTSPVRPVAQVAACAAPPNAIIAPARAPKLRCADT